MNDREKSLNSFKKPVKQVLRYFRILPLYYKLRGTASNNTANTVDNFDYINQFNANPDNPYLVSFPRTGSHWFRMIAELYFERPTLVRTFYYPDKTDYLLLHTHDNNLDVVRDNVIYLYRDPVETIYSQLNYYQENSHDIERISYWTEQYCKNLSKWLYEEQFTKKKTIITYEGMKNDLATEFAKVTAHFGVGFDQDRFKKVAQKVTKEEVKRKTPHDEQVVQLASDYQITREEFKEQYSQLIWQLINQKYSHLTQYFDMTNSKKDH